MQLIYKPWPWCHCASGDFFQFGHGSYSGNESLPILTKVSGPQLSLNLSKDLCWLANCKLTKKLYKRERWKLRQIDYEWITANRLKHGNDFDLRSQFGMLDWHIIFFSGGSFTVFLFVCFFDNVCNRVIPISVFRFLRFIWLAACGFRWCFRC